MILDTLFKWLLMKKLSSHQKTMNFQNVIYMNRREMQTHCIGISPFYSGTNTESVDFRSLNRNLPSTLLHQCTPSNPFNSVAQVSNHSMRTSGVNSLDSAFLLEGELTVESDNYDSTTWLDFLDIPVESSVGSFPSLQQANENSRMTEKMGIEIPHDKDTGIPAPAEIFEVPRMSLIPVIDLDCNKTHRSSFGRKDNSAAYFDYGVPQAETSYRQRMRWTPELHDLFLDAVKTLGGLENATPKKILGIMNVVGLNIDQVKSHLQKCRLAKNLSDQKHDKKASSVEKNAACLKKDSDATSKSDIEVLESLNIQIEAQKLLHEQIEAQRELQLRIQQNVELLKKLMEEQQQNAIPKPIHDVPTSISNCDQLSPSSSRPVINYCSASQPSTHEATKNHLKSNKRLRGEQ